MIQSCEHKKTASKMFEAGIHIAERVRKGSRTNCLRWYDLELTLAPSCLFVITMPIRHQCLFNSITFKDYLTTNGSIHKQKMSFYINLNIKFRIFGMTLGRFNQTLAVVFDPLQKNFSIQPSSDPVPVGARVMVNERGILLSGWL